MNVIRRYWIYDTYEIFQSLCAPYVILIYRRPWNQCMSKALFTDRSLPPADVRYRLWNAVTIYFTSRRFMIAINILINDLLNYNCDRYLPTQLQGGVARNLWHHLSMLHTLLLTTSQFEMCAVIPNVVHIGMLFQLDLTPFVTVMSSFNFRRPDIWLMLLVFMVSIPSDNGIKQIISLTSARPGLGINVQGGSEKCSAVNKFSLFLSMFILYYKYLWVVNLKSQLATSFHTPLLLVCIKACFR